MAFNHILCRKYVFRDKHFRCIQKPISYSHFAANQRARILSNYLLNHCFSIENYSSVLQTASHRNRRYILHRLGET